MDIIGEQGVVREVTPDLISQYDCVFTIGKTVQYCMISSTPVYVYDRFGGFGYLDAENFEKCAYANFSGRGGITKSSEEIASEIIKGIPKLVRIAMPCIPHGLYPTAWSMYLLICLII